MCGVSRNQVILSSLNCTTHQPARFSKACWITPAPSGLVSGRNDIELFSMTNIQLPDVDVTMLLVTNLQASLPDFGRIVDQHGHPAPALRQLGLVHWENGRFDTAAQT